MCKILQLRPTLPMLVIIIIQTCIGNAAGPSFHFDGTQIRSMVKGNETVYQLGRLCYCWDIKSSIRLLLRVQIYCKDLVWCIGTLTNQAQTKYWENLRSRSSKTMLVRLVNPFRLFWRKAHSTMSERLATPGPVEKSIHRKVRLLVDRRCKSVTTDTSGTSWLTSSSQPTWRSKMTHGSIFITLPCENKMEVTEKPVCTRKTSALRL